MNKTKNVETDNFDNYPIIKIDKCKLVFSKKSVELLNVNNDDRVTICYFTIDNINTFPIVGKSDIFADPESGNKLTKSNTISFRGQQCNVLKEYGDMFLVKHYKNGMFKLIPIKSEDMSSTVNLDIKLLDDDKNYLNELDNTKIDVESSNFINNDELSF